MMKQNILAKNLILNTIWFTGNQVTLERTEDEQQRAEYTLNNMAMKYNAT
jgi:hypothetical protein